MLLFQKRNRVLTATTGRLYWVVSSALLLFNTLGVLHPTEKECIYRWILTSCITLFSRLLLVPSHRTSGCLRIDGKFELTKKTSANDPWSVNGRTFKSGSDAPKWSVRSHEDLQQTGGPYEKDCLAGSKAEYSSGCTNANRTTESKYKCQTPSCDTDGYFSSHSGLRFKSVNSSVLMKKFNRSH